MALNSNISAYLEGFRKQHHWTYDQIADAARQYGVQWSSATVQSMEHGARLSDSLSNMLILASSLNDLLEKGGQPRSVTLSDLIHPLPDEVFYNLGRAQDTAAADVESVRDAMAGNPVTITTKVFGLASPDTRGPQRALGQPCFKYRRGSDGDVYRLDFDVVSDHAPTIAEKRAAEKLNMHPYDLAAFCAVRFGHTLEEESYVRAGDDSTPQKRGRATRLIIDEIRDTLQRLERQALERGEAELEAQAR